MSDLRVTNLRGRTAGAPPTLPDGVIVTGIATATTFKGALTGNVTGNASGTAGGISGTPHITVGFLTATGNVSIAGTLVYDDVTRIDSVGIVTAGGGLYVGRTEGTGTGIGATFTTAGDAILAGVVTATSFSGHFTGIGITAVGVCTVAQGTNLNGYKVEEGSYDNTALNGEFDFELENGHVQTHTGSTAGTYFPDFRVSSSQSLASVMDVGDAMSCVLMVAASNAAHYCTAGIKIDNSTSNITIKWIGSAAPTAGKGAGYDIYSFTIQKTAATPAYLVIVNATDAGP